MPTRVLMLSVEYPPAYDGGLGVAVAALGRALARRGVEVHVVTRGPARALENDDAVTVHRVAEPDRARIARDGYPGFLRWVDDLGERLETAALAVAGERAVDIVHGHEWHAGAAAERVAERCGRPLVATIHATARAKVRARGIPLRPRVEAAERSLAGAARVVTVASHWLAAEVAAHRIPRERIVVVPLGVEGGLVPSAESVRRARRALADPGLRTILVAGRLVAEKGFQDAIAALSALPEAGLAVAGSGRWAPMLRDAAASAGVTDRVRFLGRLEHEALPAHYAAADLVVVPSRYEPFGLVALEAMAAGRPLLAADVGGLAEILPPGEPAMRFPPGDAAALAARAGALLDDRGLHRRVAEAGRLRAREFGWNGVAARFAELYAGLCAAEGGTLAEAR
jgi:glycogen(starch) synthase